MKIDASIKAEFQLSHLSNLQLSASKNKDEWQFTGKTLDGQELSLQEIQESFLPHITEHLPIADLKAKDLLVDIRVKTDKENKKLYSLDLSGALMAQWEYNLGLKGQFNLEKLAFTLSENKDVTFSIQVAPFSLSDLGITLDFLKAIQIKETSLEIKYIENHFFTYFKGGVTIKDFDFTVNLTQQYDEKEKKNWFQFNGELANNYSLVDLGFFQEEIKKVIPKSIQDLTISKLIVRYNSLLEVFIFEAQIKDIIHFDVNIGKLEKIAVNECSFLFEVSKKETKVNIKGDLSINETHFISNTKLSSISGLSLEIYNRDVVEINFKDITNYVVGDIGVWDLVPPYFQKIELDTAHLLFQTSPLMASLDIETKQLGSLYGGIGRLNKEDFGVLVCITPPSHIPFLEINEHLALLETLDFTGSYLILSSFMSKSIEKTYFPGNLKDVDFIDGLTLCASLSLAPERINHEGLREKMIFFRNNILNIENLSIKATLGLDLSKITLEGYIGTIALGGGIIELNKAGISLSAMLDATLFGTIAFDLEKYIGVEKMSFSMYLKLHANGVMGYGVWEGSLGTKDIKRLGKSLEKLEDSASKLLDDYDQSQNFIKGNEVFNSEVFQKIHLLPDLQIRKLGLVLGIDWEGVPSFGCIGEFSLDGDQQKNWGIIAFLFDSTNPTQCLFDLKFPKGMQKTIENVIIGFEKFALEGLGVDKNVIENQLSENKIFRLLTFDGFYQDKEKTKWIPLRTKVAVTDVKIGNTYYDMGIMVQGKVGLLNNLLGALFNLKVNKKGIYGFGKLKKFIITINNNDLFALEESKDPIKSKDVVLKQNLEVAQSEFEGPYITLDAPFTELMEAKLHGSAHVTFLGVQLDTFYLISTKGLCFSLSVHTPIGDLLFNVIVESLTSFEAKSDFNVDFNTDIFSVKAQGSATINLKKESLTATLKFKGEYLNPVTRIYESLGDFDISFEAPPELVKVFTDIVEMIKNEIIKVAGEVFEAVKEVLSQLAEDIKQLVEDIHTIANEIDKQLHLSEKLKGLIGETKEGIRLISNSIEQVKKDIARIDRDIKKLNQQIENLTKKIEQKTKDLEKELDKAFDKVGKFILKFVGDVNTLNLSILREVKKGLEKEWKSAEDARIWHYKNRIQLTRELNILNFIPHTVRIDYHLNMEGVNESRKLVLSPPIEAVKAIISVGDTLEKEIRSLELKKTQAKNNKGKKRNLRKTKKTDQDKLTIEKKNQNDKIKNQVKRIGNIIEVVDVKKQAKLHKEELLRKKRAQLNDVTIQ